MGYPNNIAVHFGLVVLGVILCTVYSGLWQGGGSTTRAVMVLGVSAGAFTLQIVWRELRVPALRLTGLRRL